MVEEFHKQGSQVDQLLNQETEQATGGGGISLGEARGSFLPYSEAEHTLVHHVSLVQPTPEREANLGKYMTSLPGEVCLSLRGLRLEGERRDEGELYLDGRERGRTDE